MQFTLLGSGSEPSKDEAILLKMVSYSKKKKEKIDENQNIKERKKIGEPFLRPGLTGHDHFLALFKPCMKFEIFLGRMTSFEGLKNSSR